MLIPTLIVFLLCYIILIWLAWTDHKLYILPNKLNLALLICFGLFHYMLDWSLISPESAVAGLAVGGGFLLIIRYVANSLLKTDTIGLGDVKLMFAAGFGVGMPDILLVLSIGSLLGILHGYILQQVETKKTGKQTPLMNVNVPAGVGLSIATMGVISLQFWNWWEIF